MSSEENKFDYWIINGGGGAILVEQGLTVCESFKTRCFTPRVDIHKIQELSSHGMSRNAIALKLGLARATVSKALQSDLTKT